MNGAVRAAASVLLGAILSLTLVGCEEDGAADLGAADLGAADLGAADLGAADLGGPNLEAKILSAYLGITDIAIGAGLGRITGCVQRAGDEGMPVVVSLPVDTASLDPTDFTITTASGETTTPSCATLQPADEPDELQTILLAGPMGTDGDRPTAVRVTGALSSVSGESMTGIAIDTVTYFEAGPNPTDHLS